MGVVATMFVGGAKPLLLLLSQISVRSCAFAAIVRTNRVLVAVIAKMHSWRWKYTCPLDSFITYYDAIYQFISPFFSQINERMFCCDLGARFCVWYRQQFHAFFRCICLFSHPYQCTVQFVLFCCQQQQKPLRYQKINKTKHKHDTHRTVFALRHNYLGKYKKKNTMQNKDVKCTTTTKDYIEVFTGIIPVANCFGPYITDIVMVGCSSSWHWMHAAWRAEVPSALHWHCQTLTHLSQNGCVCVCGGSDLSSYYGIINWQFPIGDWRLHTENQDEWWIEEGAGKKEN